MVFIHHDDQRKHDGQKCGMHALCLKPSSSITLYLLLKTQFFIKGLKDPSEYIQIQAKILKFKLKKWK